MNAFEAVEHCIRLANMMKALKGTSGGLAAMISDVKTTEDEGTRDDLVGLQDTVDHTAENIGKNIKRMKKKLEGFDLSDIDVDDFFEEKEEENITVAFSTGSTNTAWS